MSGWATALLVAINLGLIFFLMSAPLGIRSFTLRVRIRASRDKVWNALWPDGAEAGWSGQIIEARGEGEGRFHLTLSWDGRDGRPIERVAVMEDVTEGERFTTHYVEDSSLDPSFWSNFRETVVLREDGDATEVSVTVTDRYKGFAFFAFRYFAQRRSLLKLRRWAQTGKYHAGGIFEHPLTQLGMACLSILILWSLTGWSGGGFLLAVLITMVVALHELGHMIAFRIAGHRKVRMIFIPLLGGVAIGGRPYNSHFEVAFVALMGAGFSAFLIPPLLMIGDSAAAAGHVIGAKFFAAIVACVALFNLANVVPVWKFDGGQVLRQIVPGGTPLMAASFVLLTIFLAIVWVAGFPGYIVIGGGLVLALLSLITSGNVVKPRFDLAPIDRQGRLAIAAALASVIVIHGTGVIWAFERLSV
ncbi:MAG: site-2 protease family protein [Mesorhizobium sp.]